MKKILFAFVGCFLYAASLSFGQSISNPLPDCSNEGMLEAQVNRCENQGFIEQSRSFNPIFYFVQPEPPYLAGTVVVQMVPDCSPGLPCPRIAKVIIMNVLVLNNNGTCVYRKL